MRLNVFIASAGLASRRGADQIIKAGRVTVNGLPGQLNSAVSQTDIVKLDGKLVEPAPPRYILLNKPPGYITTLKDEKGRRKVTDLINISERVVPVGRLDYDTTGALLMTNDGELANKLMHPSFEFDKVYEAQVSGAITPEILNKLSNGVELDDGVTAPARAKKLAENKVELTIHEGRNHQVKRMLAAVDLKLKKLHRSQYGTLGLEGLRPGQWRELTKTELGQLKPSPKDFNPVS
jgi:23S rRNA pseudouridine2605 synthase